MPSVPRPPSAPMRRALVTSHLTPSQALMERIAHKCPTGMDRTVYELHLLGLFGTDDQVLLTHRTASCEALVLACARGHVRLDPEAGAALLTEEGKERLLGINCLPLGKKNPRYSGNRAWRYDPYYPRSFARKAGLTGPVWRGRPPTPRITIATDASVSRDRERAGIAAVASDGRWIATAYNTRPSMGVRVAELRAILLAMSLPVVGQEVLILSDSLDSVETFNAVLQGHVPPEFESLRIGATTESFRAGLRMDRLPALIKSFPDTRVEHVYAHSGHPLNEAADSLAYMARYTLRGKFHQATDGPGGRPLLQSAHELVQDAVQDWARCQGEGS